MTRGLRCNQELRRRLRNLYGKQPKLHIDIIQRERMVDPYKPRVLFMGHRQTE